MPMRVLVADDSALFRRAIADALSSVPDVEVAGSVQNGRRALEEVRRLKPDLLTLDLEMPEMDGLAVLDALRETGEATMVIVVSALTIRGGQMTMKALEKGAVDFITKPDTKGVAESRESIRTALMQRLPALAHRCAIRNILKDSKRPGQNTKLPPAAKAKDLGQAVEIMTRVATATKPEMVLIGVSTGGPNALAQLLPAIPGNIGVPFLVVQHMPPIFTQSLAESLSSKCALRVRESSHGELIEPNKVYIAPGGRHMRLGLSAGGQKMIEITDDPPENHCKPAVDYLFRSVAGKFPGKALAVILTGMGNDGALGLRLLKRHGSYIIAQDEATSVVFGMPKAAIDAGVVDVVLPLESIASRIVATVRGCNP